MFFTHCGLVTPYGATDLGQRYSGNGLLSDGTKLLPEPMLTYRKYGPVTFILAQLHKRYPSHQSRKSASIYLNRISFKSPRGQWFNIYICRQIIGRKHYSFMHEQKNGFNALALFRKLIYIALIHPNCIKHKNCSTLSWLNLIVGEYIRG